MITEETINQTKFYKGEDDQYYLVTDVRSVKMVTMIQCSDGSEAKLLLGDYICRTFVPVVPAFEPFIQNQVVAQKPAKNEPGPIEPVTLLGAVKPKRKYKKRKDKTVHIAGQPGPRNQFSKYKGVTQGRTRKDGTVTYRAHVWNGEKIVLLGTHDSDLLAAAAVADHKGDKDEASRLRALAKQPRDEVQRKADTQEQKENNPNRPTAQKKKKTVPEWVCKRCGSKWDVKPPHCTYCNNDDFQEGEKEVD